MAKVPIYDVPQIAPGDPPDVRRYASAEVFGAGVGRQITALGGEVEKTANVLHKHALVLQERNNQAEADEAMSNYVIAQSELDNAQKQLEGKARADNFPNYIRESQKLREKFSSNMSNIDSRYMFDRETRRYFAYSVRSEGSGSASEMKRWRTNANQRAITTSNNIIIAAPEDDSLFEAEAQNVVRATRQEGGNRSWTPEETDAAIKDNISGLWANRISTLAQNDPAKANEMFEANKDKLNGTDLQKTEAQLNAGRTRAGSRASLAATQIRDRMASDIESIYRTGQGVGGLELKNVTALVGREEAEVYRQKKLAAYKIYELTHDLATLPADRMQARLRNVLPQPGSANYLREAQIYDATQKAYQAQINLRRTDPALSVQTDPVVKETEMLGPVGAQSEATGLILDARLSAQERAGIPKELQSPITAAEAAELIKPIERALPGQERQAVEQVAKNIQKIYGDKWESAFKYALRSQRQSAAVSEAASITFRRLLQGQTPAPAAPPAQTPAVTAPGAIDRAVESRSATDTINNISPPDVYGLTPEDYVVGPQLRTPRDPTKAVPLSKKILDRYGTQ